MNGKHLAVEHKEKNNTMKKIGLIIAFALSLSFVWAQDSDYKATHDGWLVSIDEAYAISKEKNIPILANFTGSDWCGWCKRLSANVFDHKEFMDWASDNVVLLELDFPRRTRIPQEFRQQNESLKNAFKVSGFPTIWVFNIDKGENGGFNINALGKTGYAKNVEEFTSGVDKMISKS